MFSRNGFYQAELDTTEMNLYSCNYYRQISWIIGSVTIR